MLKLADSVSAAIRGVQCIIILTEWEEFKKLAIMTDQPPIIIDLRNILDPESIKQIGLKYYSIGRKNEL